MRKLALLVLLASALLMNACSSGGSDSPTDTEAHPDSWFTTHKANAVAPGYDECQKCHGADLHGSGDAVSCYSCHSYNTLPPFSIHPADWTDPYLKHRGYASVNGTDSCQACHGATLQGYQAAPSCFSASYNGQSCHADGPGQAPHPLDGSYLLGTNHGPDAKANLTECQVCHGQPGGPGSNPRFNVGISSKGGHGCESCHGVNYAHPQSWAGPNQGNAFHYTAGSIQNACTLCHGVNLDGLGTPQPVGVSCLDCHAETTTFALDCTSCHNTPPDGSADLDVPHPVDHGNAANVSLHDVCVVCHGMKETATGGSFSASANYTLFNYTTGTNGDHWNGKIEMNAATQYNASTFGCNAAACHGNNPAHQLSDSGLPVALKDFGAGGTLPHPLDGSFLNPANHGPAAKGLTAEFPDGLLDCQECHAQSGGPGSNPRFNVGISSQGGAGCEGCHNDNTAHPAAGTRENVPWYNNSSYEHANVNGFTAMCTLCHGTSLQGGVGPACTSCHVVDPVANPSDCVSCHNTPPNGGALAGDVRPNRPGHHLDHLAACTICHNDFVYRTNGHFDFSAPADVVIQPNFGSPSGAGVYNSNTGYCDNIMCHGGAGSSEGPWYGTDD